MTRSEHRLDGRRLLGLLVGLAGVAVLLGFDVSAHDLLAVGAVGLVVVGYATGPMIISRWLSDLPPVGVVATSLTLTALAYAPAGLLQLASGSPLSGKVVGSALGLGIACTAVAFVLFFALIAEIGPVRATVITYFNPAVALFLGVLVLGEPLTAGAVGGFALMLAGSYLATRRPAAARAPAVAVAEDEIAAREPVRLR